MMLKYIEHEKHKIWFNYDALFKKIKSVVLKQDNNIELDHTNFEIHLLARNCIDNGEHNYTFYVNNIKKVILVSNKKY